MALRVDPGAVKPDQEHDHRHEKPEIAHNPGHRKDHPAEPGRRIPYQDDHQRRRQLPQ